MSQEDLKTITGLTSLEKLLLSDTKLNENSFLGIDNLKNLKELVLSSAKLSINDIESIARLKNIEYITFLNCTMRNNSISKMERLPNIKNITLYAICTINENDLKYLEKINEEGKLTCDNFEFLKNFLVDYD